MSDAAMLGQNQDSQLAKIVASQQFNLSVAVVIMLNSLQVMCEEIWRDSCTQLCPSDPVCVKKDIDDHAIWLVLDILFTLFFVVEAAMKLALLKKQYFMDNWNRFDFFLVIVGVFGLCFSLASTGEDNVASQTRIIRVARVLRTLRFLRIFRLFHAKMSADRYVSLELARHMKKIVTLSCFIKGQEMAQTQLVRYFGGNGKLDEKNETEIARCILQSQVNIYKALWEAGETKRKLGDKVSKELEVLRKRKRITEGFSRFVSDAHEAGALSATETHAILHPLNHQIAECMKTLNDRAEGVLDRSNSHGHNHKSPRSSVESSHGKKTSVKIADPEPDTTPILVHRGESPEEPTVEEEPTKAP
jgi:hypothetical protein